MGEVKLRERKRVGRMGGKREREIPRMMETDDHP